jgi:peptide/nickel transport system permease protein
VGTRGYLLSKILQALGTLLFVLVFNFFLFRVIGGDPARTLLRNKLVSPEVVANLRKDFGLDKPLIQQFVVYVDDVRHGNFGLSYSTRRPVSEVIGERVQWTLVLIGVSTLGSVIIGIFVGIYAAWRRGSAFDVSSTGFSLVLYSMPEFWLGIMLLIVFSSMLGWFPSRGVVTPGADLSGLDYVVDVANHMFLPALTLTLAYIGEFALVMRSSLLDVMGEDYIQTARAKGLRDRLVRTKHAVPNALLPTVSLIALHIGFIIGGEITVETVFSWPGLGLLSYEALRAPDYPLLQGLFLLFSAAVIVANLVADILYGYLDPRIRRA